MEFGDANIEDLTYVQTCEFKRLRSAEKAFNDKLNYYNLQLINLGVEKDYVIDKLQGELAEVYLEREAEIKTKLELANAKEIAKSSQIRLATDTVKANKAKLVTTESWLETLAYCKSEDDFKKVGKLFFDGFNIPKCSMLFNKKPYKQIMQFFKKYGIYINSVSPSHYPGFIFVKLEPG